MTRSTKLGVLSAVLLFVPALTISIDEGFQRRTLHRLWVPRIETIVWYLLAPVASFGAARLGSRWWLIVSVIAISLLCLNY